MKELHRYFLKLIDRWGGGTRRILRLCAEQGLPTPIFAENGDGFLVKFLFKEPIGPRKKKKIEMELPVRQQELIDILATHNKLTFKQIMNLMKNPPSERTIRNDLTELRNKGLVASEGLGRAAVWYIRDE
jgi:ATP-dependent DNA helicase RecG